MALLRHPAPNGSMQSVEANPSIKDFRLLVHLALTLRQDGYPGLMLIVGETSEEWMLGAVRGQCRFCQRHPDAEHEPRSGNLAT